LQCAAVCCSVLQCVAVCWSVLQCVAVCCSVLQCVVIPDNYFGHYMTQFEKCRSDLYMAAFDGQRYLHTIQSEDFGMAFMADLFRCNPRMLMSLIAVSETSQTMEKRSAAMDKYPKFERTVRGVPKPLSQYTRR